MNFGDVNYLAVIVAAVAGFAVGAVWYTFLFSKAWIAAVGIPEEKLRQGGSPLPFILSGIAYLLIAAFLSALTNPATVVGGAVSGLLVWLGFVLTTTTVNYAFPGRKLELTAIDTGHWLAAMVVMGAILGAFG
jgi:hypothetical protein